MRRLISVRFDSRRPIGRGGGGCAVWGYNTKLTEMREAALKPHQDSKLLRPVKGEESKEKRMEEENETRR